MDSFDPEKASARGEWQIRAEKAESDKEELVSIIKLYLLTAERGMIVKGRKKLELADIDAEARILLARLENGR